MRIRIIMSLALVGCTSVELAPPASSVRPGSAFGGEVGRVLALAPTCGAFSGYAAAEALGSVCSPKHLASASQRIRGELELRGTSVIDAERVNAEIRTRTERHDLVQKLPSAAVAYDGQIVIRGARFEDAPPALQASVIGGLGADAILASRVWVGPSFGFGGRRTVRAQLRLHRVGSGAVVWSSRCDVEIGLLQSDAVAVEDASLCALKAALGP